MTTPNEVLLFLDHYREVQKVESRFRESLDPMLKRQLPRLRDDLDAAEQGLRAKLEADRAEADRDRAEREHDVALHYVGESPAAKPEVFFDPHAETKAAILGAPVVIEMPPVERLYAELRFAVWLLENPDCPVPDDAVRSMKDLLASAAQAPLGFTTSAPLCPKCRIPMTGGAPHADGDAWQWECHRCGHIVRVSAAAGERGGGL